MSLRMLLPTKCPNKAFKGSIEFLTCSNLDCSLFFVHLRLHYRLIMLILCRTPKLISKKNLVKDRCNDYDLFCSDPVMSVN